MNDKTYDIKEYSDQALIGYAKDNGYVIKELSEGLAVCEMDIEDRHKNPLGTVHGGVVFALADTTGGIAARTMDAYPTTCSSSINYLRPTMEAKKLSARASIIKRGKNTVVSEIAIMDDKGVHVAEILATYFDLNK